MSSPIQAQAVKLVTSIIYADSPVFRDVMTLLAEHFGRPDFISTQMPFDFTRYYEQEMGPRLKRSVVSFEPCIRPETLPDIKCFTNRVEEQFSNGGRRCVNIDPGYIAPAHLILATGKGYAHRPYLRDGIYADLTLIYDDGAFRTLNWTYPDYASSEMTAIFVKIRQKHLHSLKTL
jgi:hypothetical protein